MLTLLPAQRITPQAFQPYGQLIVPTADGTPFDENDAQLHLSDGIPRFYIMRLSRTGRTFRHITRHGRCSQCLGSLAGKDWFMAVAPPSLGDKPDLQQLVAFWVPGDCFIKLAVGTWHAGPFFDHETVDFYNLELSDTNIVDHFPYSFWEHHQLEFKIS